MSSLLEKENNPFVNDELLEQLEQRADQITFNIVEGYFPTSTLKQGAQAPLYVKGRDVRFSERLTSRGAAKDIDGFFLLLKEALDDRLARENVTAENKLIFTHEYPFEESRAETITYKIIKRQPGTLSQGKQMNAQRQDYRMKLRTVIDDPDHANKKLYIYGQSYDNLVELSCWARTSKVVDARALWLENLIDEYKWFFKLEGVPEIRYEERLADTFKIVGNNGWHGRPLRYFVGTEKTSRCSSFVIRDLVMKVLTRNSLDE